MRRKRRRRIGVYERVKIRGGGLKEVGEVVDGVTGLGFLRRRCCHWNLDLDNSREKKMNRVCEQKIGIKNL